MRATFFRKKRSLLPEVVYVVYRRYSFGVFKGDKKVIGIRRTEERAKKLIKFYSLCHKPDWDSEYTIEEKILL